MATVRLSKKFTLQISDAWRSAFLAVVTPVLVYVYDWANGDHELNWRLAIKMAIAAGISYLIKNFAVEPAKVVTSVDTNLKAENANDKIKEAVSQ